MADERPSIRSIAAATGVSPSTVARVMAALPAGSSRGRDGRVRPSRRTDTTERDRQIRRLYRGKKSMRAIASELGCSVGTVHRVLKQPGGQTK